MRSRLPRSDAGDADTETVLHIYTVDLYAAIVDGYIDWHKAIVDAAVRASLSEDKAVHFRGHERCVSTLARLLQFTHAYGQGATGPATAATAGSWGLRNYLAHCWTRGGDFASLAAGLRTGPPLDASAQRDARRQPRLLPVLRPAGGRRPRHTGAQEAPEVRRSGPPAQRGRPAVQSRARRRRLRGARLERAAAVRRASDGRRLARST